SEKSGDEMTYTLAIVDEGLLDLTAFRTPNPWPDFYAREALGVRTWDVYNWVMGAYAGSLNQLLSIGGDQELKNTSRNNANRFKPAVRFMGPFSLSKGKKANHNIKLPAYVGAVRVMVVAGNQTGAYGNCEKSVEVKNSIMTLSTLPRIAAPEDEMWLPVNLFVTEKGISSVSVSVKTKNGILSISGNASQQVSVKAPEDKVLFFKLKAGVKCGTEVVSITSKTGSETFTETIELNVSNPNLPVVSTIEKTLQGNESGTLSWNFPDESTNRSVSFSASGMPGINLAARLNYLIGYPHGCAEQIISKAYPQLYLSALVPLNEVETKEMKTAVQNAIQKVYGLQMANGGFTYWQGGKTSDAWVTSYAGAFLTEAKNKGYDISANVLSKWLEYQKQASRNWDSEGNRYTQMDQAYRLYTMALANTPDLSGMNRLRGLSNLTNEARWMLACTFAVSGRDAICKELLAEAKPTFERESNFGFDFGSELRDESNELLTLIQINDMKEAQPLAMNIARRLSSDQQYSTQATAFALMSMADYAKKIGKGPLNFTWQTDKNKSAKVESVYPMWQSEIKNAGKSGNVTVKNNGGGTLFTQLTQSYIPLFDKTEAVNKGLSMKVSYVLANGTQTNIQSMKQGTNFTMIAEITNTSNATDYTNLALTEVFPAGWENLSTRYAGISEMKSDFDYQDIRDDRVATFFGLKKGETKRFVIRLQAAYAGKFYMPAIQCEAMYDATVIARTKAQEVTITRE
ncbi:MAG: alpha-2-macroglobulin family protein, partial [Bacteroidales bacterium]